MAIESILVLIDSEIARLTQVRALLAGSSNTVPVRGSGLKTAKAVKASKTATRARVLSPEARKRIADAQRKRWAAQKAANKKEA